MLVGRDDERAEIDALLEDARRGRSRVLVYTGAAGIGKSALLEYAQEQAVGMRVLSVVGVESESTLPFGALHALLRPLLPSIDELPERQRESLSAALALAEGDEPDRLATYAGALTLLADATAAQTLLVVVDDAHWLDPESASTLAFVARRVAGEDLALLAAVRDGEPSAFDHATLPTRALSPLSENESLELLRIRHGDRVTPDGARAVVAAGGGNPLALVELPHTLTPDQLAGLAPLEEPLPLADRIETSFLRRTVRLPVATREALLVAAAGVDAPPSAIRAAAAALGSGDLAEAERAGLVRVDPDAVRFVHPLMRSAIYQAASPADRRRAHQALAAELAAEPDLQAWQLAAAADLPDESIAAALEAAADRAAARGGLAARERALQRAGELSPDPGERGRRTVAAALSAFWAGDGDRVRSLCDRVLQLSDDPLQRADVVHLRCALDVFEGRGMVPAAALEHEIELVAHLDPERAAKLLLFLARRYLVDFEFDEVESATPRLEALIPGCAPEWQARLRVSVAAHHQVLGNVELTRAGWDGIDDPHAYVAFAPFPMWLERYDEVHTMLSRELERARREHALASVCWTLGCAAALELWLGRLEEARRLSAEALAYAEVAGPGWLPSLNHSTLASIAAIRGQEALHREHAGEAARLAAQAGEAWQLAFVRLPPALFALGLGRHEEVVELLRPVDERLRLTRLAEPGFIPYHADLVEAYARLGMVDDARALLDRFARQGQELERAWVLAAAARCDGLLADPGDVDAAFTLALELHSEVPSPFERARTELCYGERLRRTNRRRDARPHLRAALETFDALEAAPWSERARAELRATGERVPRRRPDRREQLTPQELQISTLVAQGLTNREIGAQIFLSPKTVEYHLTHVYRKLGLHSRAELIRSFSAPEQSEAVAVPE